MRSVGKAIWTDMLLNSPVFTTAEVADIAGVRGGNASRDLARLEELGMVTRIRRGLWCIPNHPDFSPFAVVPHLFSDKEGGYVSLLSALNLHGMIEQIPPSVHIMATRQRADLVTPVGRYEFHKIRREFFAGFGPYHGTGNFDIATPAKALFDTIYLSVRKGKRFAHLPELDFPEAFSREEVGKWIARIDHDPLRTAVRERWMAMEGRAAREIGADAVQS